MASCVGYAHAHVTRVWVMGGVNSLMHTRACGGRRDVRSGHWGARNIVTGYVSRRSCAAASACIPAFSTSKSSICRSYLYTRTSGRTGPPYGHVVRSTPHLTCDDATSRVSSVGLRWVGNPRRLHMSHDTTTFTRAPRSRHFSMESNGQNASKSTPHSPGTPH